jgi:hypothetical protein
LAQSDEHLAVQSDGLSPAPLDLPPIAGPQQYQMQFTTSEEHVQLVERAKALLARSRPGVTLGEEFGALATPCAIKPCPRNATALTTAKLSSRTATPIRIVQRRRAMADALSMA